MKKQTELLTKRHKKQAFDCGIESLNTYLKKYAKQDVKRKLAACFVLTDEENKVLGYYTLSSSSIPKDAIPEKIQKKLPYEELPVTLLGRLAIDLSCQGKKLGQRLLIEALQRALFNSEKIASAAVVVDPINESAVRFYKRFGFITLPTSQRMFLPMATLVKMRSQ